MTTFLSDLIGKIQSQLMDEDHQSPLQSTVVIEIELMMAQEIVQVKIYPLLVTNRISIQTLLSSSTIVW